MRTARSCIYLNFICKFSCILWFKLFLVKSQKSKERERKKGSFCGRERFNDQASFSENSVKRAIEREGNKVKRQREENKCERTNEDGRNKAKREREKK